MALAVLLRDHAGDLDVERAAPKAPAEFRLLPPEGAAPKDLAAAIGELDGIETAFAMGPRVYLRPTTGLLADAVLRAVRDRGPLYGHSAAGRDVPLISSIGCPNANKPLHIGHLRNCFLGMAVSRLFETQGHDLLRTEELSNFGIHICQALAAYRRWGDGTEPDRKYDHWVGAWYTRFHQEDSDALARDASDLLLAMEAGDGEALALNTTFTEWAIEGIRETYERIGLRHDFVLRELEALPVAMELIEKGLAGGVCLRREDGSVYVDLTDAGLGEVTLLRRDGTPLSLVFFVAIWVRRAQIHPKHGVIRVTGEQWRESFLQFLEILRRLGRPDVADATEGVWYGMIRAAEGKIRSREGNDVAADTLLDRFRDRLVEDWARVQPLEGYHLETCERLAVALLKFHLLARRRDETIVYDDEAVWNDSLPRVGRILTTLTRLEDATGDAVDRELVLALNALPWIFERACGRRDAADVVTYVEGLVRLCRKNFPGAGLATATATVVRNALWVLDLGLPSSGRELPPAARGRNPPGRV